MADFFNTIGEKRPVTISKSRSDTVCYPIDSLRIYCGQCICAQFPEAEFIEFLRIGR